jgi:hypothetical protein
MLRGMVPALLTCLLLAGCSGGGGGSSQADAWIPTDTATQPDAANVPDGGCDDDVMGEDYCIKNPGTNAGNPSLVNRLPLPQCW